jgi:hypothetical protein
MAEAEGSEATGTTRSEEAGEAEGGVDGVVGTFDLLAITRLRHPESTA